MPRKNLVRSDRLPYHITARVNNREDFPLSQEKFWNVLAGECLNACWVYEVEFHAILLMPNHFHIILSVPKYDLGKVMNTFMSSITRTTNLMSGRSGRLFGAPYFWSLINSSRYFGHALKYVYRNPVRAKICEKVEDYPYSTLHGLIGSSHLPVPIHLTQVGMEISLPSTDPITQLAWLNRPFPTEAEELIRQGLRKRTFDGRKHPLLKMPEILEALL